MHRINWNQPNIPIKRENLEWLPSSYLNNPEEYPIWQFEISKSTGRIIGFFNENSTTFYILLLDPNHNMQPCSTYGYKIDDTKVGLTEIEYIEQKLSMLRRKSINCKVENCALNTVFPPKMGGYIYIDEELMRKYEELLRDGRFYELFDSFLLDKL